MGTISYVMRRGKRIEVETISDPIDITSPKHKATEPFVKVPWWWITRAAELTRSPKTLMLMELLHASWRAKSATFPLPNTRLNKLGVSREIKRRVLRDLEQAGLITIAGRHGKAPTITLVGH